MSNFKKYRFRVEPKRLESNGVYYTITENIHERIVDARSLNEARFQIESQYGGAQNVNTSYLGEVN